MTQLSSKTRKNASVYGIPKVYFCCHPKDFDVFFEDISNEILSMQNCSIWHHGKEPVEYTEEFFEDLSQMHLFVIPVTRRFLQEGNPALEKEFRFASESRIPILPLMQESGLEKKFNRLCGDIQYLDKYINDGTSIEYTDKLEKFLSAVLLRDELARKVRDAFDAYIFLSYRKKDRRHAQTLMRLIHQNDFCRDIAIWYDEFLVPGENFNEAISEALKKSSLFILTVTPNVVNEDNYIMDVEFPMAKEQNKPILPCEMLNTDKTLLAQKYVNIPACADGRDQRVLSECLRRHFHAIASKGRDNSPKHLFFVGLAYLHGFDVEVDRDCALKLITAAAESDLPEAIEQLIGMYTNGNGVPIDENKALSWRKKLLAVTKSRYEREKNFSTAFSYMDAYLQLAQAEHDMRLYPDAITHTCELKKLCHTLEGNIECTRVEFLNIKRYAALSDLLLGRICHVTNEFELAREHFELARAELIRLNEKLEDPALLKELAVLYGYMAGLCKVKAQYADALLYYEKALSIQQYITEHFGNEEHLPHQILTLIHVSELQRIRWDYANSRKSALTALKLIDEASEVRSRRKFLSLRMEVLFGLAEAFRLEGAFSDALRVYDELLGLEKLYIREYGVPNTYARSKRLVKITQIYFQMSDYEAVIRCGEQAIEALEDEDSELMQDFYTATGGAEGAGLYVFVAMAYFVKGGDMRKVTKYFEVAVRSADAYVERSILCNVPDIIMIYSAYGDVLQTNGELSEAGRYLEKAVRLYEKHLFLEGGVRNATTAFILYVAVGRNRMAQGMLTEAIDYLKKAETLYQKTIVMAPGAEQTSRRDWGMLCFQMANCYIELDDPRAKDYYLRCLEAYDLLPEEKYLISDWDTVVIVAYQLYCMENSFIKLRKWRKRLVDAVYKLRQRYPSEYQQTVCYEMLNEMGIFD